MNPTPRQRPPAAFRMLITGASGAGSSTLAAALAPVLSATYLDGDHYFWLKPEPPFTDRRPVSERLTMLLHDLQRHPRSVLAGAVEGWGLALEDAFDVIVFLRLPAPLRVARLRAREVARFGAADEDFLRWASDYDTGTTEGRDLAKQGRWLAERTCPVIELPGDLSVAQRVEAVLKALAGLPLNPARG